MIFLLNNLSTALRNAIVDAWTARIDSGAGAGLLEIWTTGYGTKLATLVFSDPSYGASSSGTAQENPIADDASADATGTAGAFRVTSSTPTTEYEGTVGTAGADINFNSVAFVIGDTVAVTDFPLTQPAS
jgi:hypothetical protein